MASGAVPSSSNGSEEARRFALNERRTPAGVVLSLVGELDHDSAPALRETLEHLLASGDPRLLVDCSQLGFCDSSGLNVLLKARLAAQARGTGLDLVAVGAQVARVLQITGATTVFTIYASMDEALAGGSP